MFKTFIPNKIKLTDIFLTMIGVDEIEFQSIS